MTRYNVYVTELWTRRYGVDAETEQEAVKKAQAASAAYERWHLADDNVGDPELAGTFAPDGSEIDAKSLAWTVEVEE